MEVQINATQIHTLMNEHSLSDSTRNEISNKIHNIINFINFLNTIKSNDDNLKSQLLELSILLSQEQKATARIIVSKNNLLSKNLIKSMATQKENLLQVIEISQLRLEAELKNLNEKLSYLVIKTETSFFNKLFSIFKIPFKNKKLQNNATINHTREKISLTTSKLNSLEKRKEDLAQEFGSTGTDALKYLNKITYKAFLPVYDISNSHLENLKNKITILSK